MADKPITLKIVGSDPKDTAYETLQDLFDDKPLEGYSASINGNAVTDMGYKFEENDFVLLAPKAKGN